MQAPFKRVAIDIVGPLLQARVCVSNSHSHPHRLCHSLPCNGSFVEHYHPSLAVGAGHDILQGEIAQANFMSRGLVQLWQVLGVQLLQPSRSITPQVTGW